MPYGTLSISDLLAMTTQSIVQVPGYEEQIWRTFDDSIAAHNRIMNELMGEFVERSTARMMGTGGTAQTRMDDIDEFGSPHVQKVTVGENYGFPLRLTGTALGWTRTFLERKSVAWMAKQMLAAQDADRVRITRDIKRAFYSPTNYAFVDVRVEDRATLNVKALANADGMSVPLGPNGETFPANTHTHYFGTAAFANTDLDAGITLVAEHSLNPEIQIVIARANENAVRGFAGFQAYVDARIVQSQTAMYARGDLNLFNVNDRDIGIYNGAVVGVRPWAVPNYVFFYNRRSPKILVMREFSQGSGDFRMSYEDENHPLYARGFEREFGLAPKERWSAAILYTGGASYVAPTITA